MYKELRGLKPESLKPESLEALPVQIPLPHEIIRQHPMDPEDPKTQRRLNNVAAILRPGYSSSEIR